MNSSASPILKWAGGKRALAPTLLQLFPAEYHVYYDPFVGGGSILLALNPRSAVVSDENEWLIDTYREIRRNWQEVASELDTMINSREEYSKIRAIDPRSLPHPQRAAHLIYLNKTCFRGLFRVNRRGNFNVPYGAYDRRYYDPENLREFAARLHGGIQLRCGDFEIGLDGITSADFAYLDPPYYKKGGYSDFNRYTSSKFGSNDHIRLAAVCRELDSRGIRWAASNSDTGFIRRLFRGFRIRKVSARREIKLQARERSISELIITNY